MGTLIGFDGVEDLYKIRYEGNDVEELAWADLNRLLRASGDSITAPNATPPLFMEASTPMSAADAMEYQRKSRSSPVFGLVSGYAGATTVALGFNHQNNPPPSKTMRGKAGSTGFSSESQSDSDYVMGQKITATNERSPARHTDGDDKASLAGNHLANMRPPVSRRRHPYRMRVIPVQLRVPDQTIHPKNTAPFDQLSVSRRRSVLPRSF